MCIAMLPTAFAGEADTRETITLNLHRDNLREDNGDGTVSQLVHNDTEANSLNLPKNSSAKIADLIVQDKKYEWVTDKSVTHDINTIGNYSTGGYGRRMQYYTQMTADWVVWPEYTEAKERMFTVKTNIGSDAAGYYNVKITGMADKTGGEFAVYVNGKYVGDFNNFSSSSNTADVSWTLDNAIKLTEGPAEISLRARKYYRSDKAVTDWNNASLYLGLIQLIPTSEPTISEVESTIPETIEKDSTAELSAKVKMADNTYRSFGYTDAGVVPTTDDVVTVTSSDPAVIGVTEVVNVQVNDPKNRDQILDPTTVTYKLTALKGGKSDITVTAFVDGQTKTLTKTVTVPTPRETITLDLHQNNLSEKDVGAFIHQNDLKDGETVNSTAYIKDLVVADDAYEWVADKSVADDVVSIANNVYNSLRGRRMQYKTSSKYGNQWDMTWEAWPFFQKPQNVMFTIKTKIPEGAAGYYNVKITGAAYNCGGEYAVYVNREYAGDINSYASTSSYEAKEWSLNNAVNLPAGEVEISLRAVKFYRARTFGSQDNNASIYLGFIELIPTDAPSISAVESTIPTGLSEGDMRDLSVKVKMSDGIYRSFGYTDEGELPEADETVKVTSSDPTVVEVKDVVVVERNIANDLTQELDPTTVTYKLAAKKAGTAKITVTAYVDGKTEIKEETITVTGLGADAVADAGTVTLGILTNYSDAESGITTNYNVNGSNQVSVGTAVTAEAEDVGDYKFMYWKVGGTTTKGGTFITADSKLENYVVNTNTSLIAVYEDTTDVSKTVEFWTANERFIEKLAAKADGTPNFPTAYAPVTGFGTTGKWLVAVGKYLESTEILPDGTTRAVEERNDTGNAITGSITVNGEAVSEALTYDNKIERTVEGAKYWTRDGKVVFYGETYTYHMWDATAIESHTDDIVAVPTVVLDDPANGAYMIEYCVPEGYKKLEAGILFAKGGSPNIGTFSSKAASQSDSCHGQFTAQSDDGETVARGYLVYEDKLGNKKVIYAELPSAEE